MLIDFLISLFGQTNKNVSNAFFFFLPSQALLQLFLQVTNNFKELPLKLFAGPSQTWEKADLSAGASELKAGRKPGLVYAYVGQGFRSLN